MVKADDLQVLQLSCSIRRQGVKSRQAAADGSERDSDKTSRETSSAGGGEGGDSSQYYLWAEILGIKRIKINNTK